MRSIRSDARGVVYTEFLIAFMPILLLFLGIVQLGLLFPARLMVNHAANRAVRSAIVVLDDDPRYYPEDQNGERSSRGSLRGERLSEGQLTRALRRAAGAGGGDPADTDLSRRATIELAAAMMLAPLASAERGSIAGALARPTLEAKAAATIQSMRVKFLNDGGPTESFGIADEVTVRVEYDYRCPIPVVSRLVCGGGVKTLRAEATLMNHGARYRYLP